MVSDLLVSQAYLALLMLAVIAGVATAVAAWQFHDRPGGRAFAVLTAAVVLWALGDLVGHFSATVGQAMVAQRVTYLAISVVPVAWVVLAFQYVGRSSMVTRRRVALLSVVPAATLLVSLTNGSHHLLWEVHGIGRVGAMTTLDVSPGPWFLVHTLYSYGLLVVGAGVLLSWSLRARDAYRAQTVAVLVAVALPWAVNVVYVTGVAPVPADATPLAFSGACVVLWVGLFRYRFLDVLPVARDRVVEEMHEGVVVLDDRDRVVDVNPAAQRLLVPDDLVGEHIESVFAAETVDRSGAVTDGDGRITVDRPDGTRHFDVRISPLSVRSGDRVVIFHDVTEEERRRKRLAEQTERLERQNERLDRFASVLSHDLRNPLSIARGWTQVLAEDDVNEDALERVRDAHERIDGIVADTLALARSDGDADTEAVRIDELVREAWGTVESDGQLHVETDDVVLADPDRTLRLLENLFRNAVDHASDDVAVTVGRLDGGDGANEADGTVRADGTDETEGGDGFPEDDAADVVGFYVEDDGPGIDECDREDVFEYGYSSDDEGTGLGLAIVRDVADAHGWTVRLETADSGGARVSVEGVEAARRPRARGE